jgi:hypothetical protein
LRVRPTPRQWVSQLVMRQLRGPRDHVSVHTKGHSPLCEALLPLGHGATAEGLELAVLDSSSGTVEIPVMSPDHRVWDSTSFAVCRASFPCVACSARSSASHITGQLARPNRLCNQAYEGVAALEPDQDVGRNAPRHRRRSSVTRVGPAGTFARNPGFTPPATTILATVNVRRSGSRAPTPVGGCHGETSRLLRRA